MMKISISNIWFPILIAFVSSLVITYLIILFFKKRGTLLKTRNDRWSKKPTPSFGGIAIFATFTIASLVFVRPLNDILPILIGGAAIFTVGILDDIFDIKPYTRLLVEIAVACLMILSGVHIIFQTNPIIYIPLTILWIVGLTNAFNLLDNMDGLAPGIGAIAACFLFLISVKLGLTTLVYPSMILASALLAFLIFNFNPAKIFLGDCGALYVGFILATLSIKGTWHQASNLFLIMLTPLLILGIPIFDTAFVTLQRKFHGLPITQGGKDHSSHRLVLLGWSEKKAAIFLYIISIILGLTAIVGLDHNIYIKSVGFAITLITVILFGMFLAQAKVYGDKSNKTDKKSGVKLISNVLYKRRILDILIDSAIIIVAYISAYLIKYDGEISPYNLALISQSLPLIVIIKLSSCYVMGLYKGVWKYIDFDDALRIMKAALVGSTASVIFLLGFIRFSGYSRSLFVIDFILFIFLLSMSRIVLRLLRESFYSYPKLGTKVLLIGAGEGGRLALSEIRKNPQINLNPIAILDDDEAKHGKKLMGIPVIGSTNEIESIVLEKEIEKVLITIPSASSSQRQEIAKRCEAAGVDFKIMQSFDEVF